MMHAYVADDCGVVGTDSKKRIGVCVPFDLVATDGKTPGWPTGPVRSGAPARLVQCRSELDERRRQLACRRSYFRDNSGWSQHDRWLCDLPKQETGSIH